LQAYLHAYLREKRWLRHPQSETWHFFDNYVAKPAFVATIVGF